MRKILSASLMLLLVEQVKPHRLQYSNASYSGGIPFDGQPMYSLSGRRRDRSKENIVQLSNKKRITIVITIVTHWSKSASSSSEESRTYFFDNSCHCVEFSDLVLGSNEYQLITQKCFCRWDAAFDCQSQRWTLSLDLVTCSVNSIVPFPLSIRKDIHELFLYLRRTCWRQ